MSLATGDTLRSPSAARAQITDTGSDLILLLGQSNMSGRGTAIDTSRYDPPDPRILQYGNSGTYANVISQAVEPLAMHDTPTGMGPGAVFARFYATTRPANRRILLVPAAHGGTAFETGALNWKVTTTGSNSLYLNAVNQTLAALAAAGPGSRLAAILWVQGETDGDNSTSGATYQADLDALIAGLRTALAAPTAPFIIGQMVPEYLTTGTRSAIDAVHQSTPGRVANTAFAFGAYGMNNADGNHYNAPGARFMGREMFYAYLRLLTGAPTTAPSQVTGVAAGTPTGTTVPLTWAAVTGATHYIVERRLSPAGSWATVISTIYLAATATGLSNGTAYDFRVTARNAAGTGTASATATATTGTPPPQVTGLAAGTATTSTVPLSWSSTAGATSYLVEYKLSSASTWTSGPTPSGTSTTVTGLATNSSYDFRVSGVNTAGTGTPSTTVTTSTPAWSSTALGVAVQPAYAYSLRQVVNTYAGPAIRVRRSSDSTEQDIGFNAGALDTAALTAFVGANNGLISKIYDQSGNGRDIAQTTTTAQPTLVTAGTTVLSGGKPALTFDGTDDVLYHATPALYSAASATVCGVLKASTPSAAKRWWAESASTASSSQYGLSQPDNNNARAYPLVSVESSGGGIVGASLPGSLNTFDGAIHQLSATDTGSAMAQWLDAAADLASTAYTRPTSLQAKDRFAVGGVVRSGSLAPLAMTFSEAVYWPSVLSTTDRQTAQTDQKAYYGTP